MEKLTIVLVTLLIIAVIGISAGVAVCYLIERSLKNNQNKPNKDETNV